MTSAAGPRRALERVRRHVLKARCITCFAPCAGDVDDLAFCRDCLERPDQVIRSLYEDLGVVD